MRFSAVVFLFMSFMGWSNPMDSIRTEERDGQLFVIHQVDPGETLYAISRRYGATVDVVTSVNDVQNNAIQVGQLLAIPVARATENSSSASTPSSKVHVVASGETLYGISRQYGVSVDEIKQWNDLTTESLAIGQRLAMNSAGLPATSPDQNLIPFPRAERHYVQSGQNLMGIAEQRNVSVDSLMKWNNLRSDDLMIGQILWFRSYDRSSEPVDNSDYFGRIIEEGIAMQIEDMQQPDKYLALHKTLPIGTLMEVRNLMNNKKVFVRVVGQLPDTGPNENVLIRLTEKSFNRLGILDARARVELTYYED